MPLEMEWNIAYILRKLNVKETQSNRFCLCPVLPFSLCVCVSLQANCFPWQLCGECDINPDPVGVRYWGRSLQLRLFVRVWSLPSSCSGEPLGAWGAPKNSMGSALHMGKSSWQGQRGGAEGAEPGDSMGQTCMMEGGYLRWEGRGLMGKRRDTVSLGLLHWMLPTYRSLPGLAEMDKFSVLLAG